MGPLRFILTVLLLCAFSLSSFATDKKTAKSFFKVQKYTVKGDYHKARLSCEILLDKLKSGLVPNADFDLAKAYVTMAKIQFALGNLMKVEESLVAAQEKAKVFKGSKSDQYVEIMALVASLEIDKGDYAIANSLLNKTEKELKRVVKGRSIADGLFYFQRARLEIKCGNLKLAANHNDESLNKFLARYNYIINGHAGKFPKKELLSIARHYARANNQNAEIQYEIGMYKRALTSLDQSLAWISSHLGSSDITAAENHNIRGQCLELLEDYQGAKEMYSEAMSTGKKGKGGLKYGKLNYDFTAFQENYTYSVALLGNIPRAYFEHQKQVNEAVEYFGSGTLPALRQILIDAELNLIAGEGEEAQNLFETVLKSNELTPTHPLRARAYSALIDLYSDKDHAPLARKYAAELIKVREKVCCSTCPEYLKSRLRLADYYALLQADSIEQAIDIYEEFDANVVRKELGVLHPHYLGTLNKLGEMYESAGKYTKSVEKYEYAVKSCERGVDADDYHFAVQLSRLAKGYIHLGQFDKSKSLVKKSLRIFDLPHNKSLPEYLEPLMVQAKLATIEGDFDEAELIIDKALKKSKKTGGDIDREEFIFFLIRNGEYSDAQDFILEELEIRSEQYGEDHPAMIVPMLHLADYAFVTGDFVTAQLAAKTSAELALKYTGKDNLEYVNSNLTLAKVYNELGDYKKAEKILKELVTIQEKLFKKHQHLQIAETLNQLAISLYHIDLSNKESEELFEEAIDITKAILGQKNPPVAEIYQNFALYYLKKEKYVKAERLLGMSDDVWADNSSLGKTNIHSANIELLRGDLAIKLNKYREAEKFYTAAKNSLQKLFGQEHKQYASALAKLAKLNYVEGDIKAAVRQIEEAAEIYLILVKDNFLYLSERQKMSFWSLVHDDFEFLYSLAFQYHEQYPSLIDRAYNIHLNSKALLLSSSKKLRQTVRESDNPEIKMLFDDWVRKREDYIAAQSMDPEQREKRDLDLESLRNEIESIEKKLSLLSSDFASSINEKKQDDQINWQQVKNVLKPNETVVEIIRYRYFDRDYTDSIIYVALVVDNNHKRHPGIVVFPNGNTIDSRFKVYYKNASAYRVKDTRTWSRLWHPIEKELTIGNTIYLSGMGVYNEINVEALQGTNKKYVMDEYNIVQITSSKELAQIRMHGSPHRKWKNAALLMGNPEYFYKRARHPEHEFSPLPGTEKEVKSIESTFNNMGWATSTFVGAKATEGNLKSMKGDPRVLHIATHGFFKGSIVDDKEDAAGRKEKANPLNYSGLILAYGGEVVNEAGWKYLNLRDGVLTANEVMNMDLGGVEMVVLSACETGRGKEMAGQGVFGLQRAFEVAGAKLIIMSLFKVADEPTQKLMSAFYQKLNTAKDVRDAFKQAKMQVRSSYPDPIDWGAFVMIGMEE